MPWMAAATMGSAVIGGIANGGAQDQSAHNAQLAAQYADPFHQYRSQYAPLLNNLMGVGSGPGGGSVSALASLQNRPSYQFRYNQGLQALNSSLAARGMLGSGNRLAALTNYGQDYASNEYNNEYNRLAGLSGASSGQMGAAGQSFGNISQQGVGYGVQSSADMAKGLGAFGGYMSGNGGGGGGTGSYGGTGSSGGSWNTGGSGFSNSGLGLGSLNSTPGFVSQYGGGF